VTAICQEYRKIHKNIKNLRNPKGLILGGLQAKFPNLSLVSSFCAFYTAEVKGSNPVYFPDTAGCQNIPSIVNI